VLRKPKSRRSILRYLAVAPAAALAQSGFRGTDGYYEQPDGPDPRGDGAWIGVLRVGWESGSIRWFPLCRHGSSWRSQDAHPHPVFDHAGKAVISTSDRTGRRTGYRAPEQLRARVYRKCRSSEVLSCR
jgi:hypothetical protein